MQTWKYDEHYLNNILLGVIRVDMTMFPLEKTSKP